MTRFKRSHRTSRSQRTRQWSQVKRRKLVSRATWSEQTLTRLQRTILIKRLLLSTSRWSCSKSKLWLRDITSQSLMIRIKRMEKLKILTMIWLSFWIRETSLVDLLRIRQRQELISLDKLEKTMDSMGMLQMLREKSSCSISLLIHIRLQLDKTLMRACSP